MLIQQPYYKGFPGGLTGHCNQYQSAFSRLMELKVVHDDDAMKGFCTTTCVATSQARF
jgi:hypothetical protein